MGSIIYRRHEMLRSIFYILFLFVLALSPGLDSHASAQDPATTSAQSSNIAGENFFELLADDGSYLYHSLYSDAGDLLTLPLRVKEVTLTDVVIATVVLGTIPATIYGLDSRIERNVKNLVLLNF